MAAFPTRILMLSAFPEKMKFKCSKLLVGIPVGKATGIKKTSKIPIEVPVRIPIGKAASFAYRVVTK